MKQKGYSLIELIVVIVIIGILAAVAIPSYLNFTKEARVSVMENTYGSVLSSVEMFHGAYILNNSDDVIVGTQRIETTPDGYPFFKSQDQLDSLIMFKNGLVSEVSGGGFTVMFDGKVNNECMVKYTPYVDEFEPSVVDIVTKGCI